MRVSKVKVDNKEMVLMHRTSSKGILVYESKPTEDKTTEILPEEKLDNFALSILNKTIIKKPTGRNRLSEEKEKIYKFIERLIRSLIKGESVNLNFHVQNLTKETIQEFLSHRFRVEMKYVDNGQEIKFDLADLICHDVKLRKVDQLKKYVDWKNWYIQNKSSILIKSIENNRIDFDQHVSKRKKTLELWGAEYSANGTIDLSAYHKIFKIEELAKSLNQVGKGELDIEKGVPKHTNNFHRALKKALQTHQKEIFGTREIPLKDNRDNKQLAIYNLEVVKYLEHYFSVKSSQRRNTKEDVSYYLKEETIKKTVTNQLLNAVRNNLLQQGKAQLHGFDSTTSSSTLSAIKRNEAFVLNMIDTCAFTANNIRNIVDPSQMNDIIVKRYFEESFTKQTVNDSLFELYFNCKLPEFEVEKTTTLWAMRGAVQQIRNNVVHYKQNALNDIFNITGFENPLDKSACYINTIYKNALKNEIEKVPEAFAKQLSTGGVLSFFQFEQIKTLLNTFTFSLCRSVVPFAPGFKKIHKQGQNYQNASSDNFYELELTCYLKTEDFGQEEYNARYFLLKLIYNNLFLPQFTDDIEKFTSIVQFIQLKNKKYAENSNKPKAFAFEGIRAIDKKETIASYMAYIQGQLMLEQNKKEDGIQEDTRINFEKFVLQVFIKGFDEFLKAKEFDFLKKPHFQFSQFDSDQQKAEKINDLEAKIATECRLKPHAISINESSHIAFYTFCKLLDANHLSNLRNELIKFKQSTNNFDKKQMFLFEIIELCMFSADTLPKDYNKLLDYNYQASLELTKRFIEPKPLETWGDLYLQSDKTTPVVHANIELCRKYGTVSLLEKLINKATVFKITEDEYKNWQKLQKTIESNLKQREELHQQWVDNKNKDDAERKTELANKRKFGKDYRKKQSDFAKKFIAKNREEYLKVCNEIEQYNWLDNKLHFVHLNRLHLLTIDIVGRMAGFVALFDRDFQMMDATRNNDLFQLKSFVNLRKIDKFLSKEQKRKDKLNNYQDIKNGNIIKSNSYENITVDDWEQLTLCMKEKRKNINSIFLNLKDIEDDEKIYTVRNFIAHFNYITTSASEYSLLDLINELRELLQYDRKLKNAVSKAFIDLFDKHGMMLKLQLNLSNHKLEIQNLEPKKTNPFGNQRY